MTGLHHQKTWSLPRLSLFNFDKKEWGQEDVQFPTKLAVCRSQSFQTRMTHAIRSCQFVANQQRRNESLAGATIDAFYNKCVPKNANAQQQAHPTAYPAHPEHLVSSFNALNRMNTAAANPSNFESCWQFDPSSITLSGIPEHLRLEDEADEIEYMTDMMMTSRMV